MADRDLSLARLADVLSVHKSTLSRSLATGAFSAGLSIRVREVVAPIEHPTDNAELLRKALRILAASDTLRRDAERMLVEALDRTARKA